MRNPLFEFTPCPCCGSESFKYWYSSLDMVTHTSTIFSLVSCNNCSLVRTQPTPTPDSISYFYPDTYPLFTHSSTTELAPTSSSNTSNKGFLSFLRATFVTLMQPLVKPSKTLKYQHNERINHLDYGCASGQYIESLSSSNFKSVGIDFAHPALSAASLKGIDIYLEPIPASFFPPGYFDLITAWMVIEHLPDPISILTKLADWLSPTGYLHLSVPDSSTIFRKLFRGASYDNHTPAHFIHPNHASMTQILSRAGLEILETRYQPNARTLTMSFLIFLDSRRMYPLSYSSRILHSKLFLKCEFFLGYLLALFRQSGRMEIIAVKTITSLV